MNHRTMLQLALLALLPTSCTGEARDVSETAQECGPSLVEGQVVPCDCDDGSESVQECLPGNLLSVCDCGLAEPADQGEPGDGDARASGDQGDNTGDGASSTGQPDGEMQADAGDSTDAPPASGGDQPQDPFAGFFGQQGGGGDPPQDPFGGVFGGGMAGSGAPQNPFGGMSGGNAGGGQSNPFGGQQGGMGQTREGTGDGEELDACSGDDGCSEGLLCYVAGGFCTPECEDDGDCAGLGGADWSCGTTGTCRVICDSEAECPDGQVCNPLPMGGGGRCGQDGFSFGF